MRRWITRTCLVGSIVAWPLACATVYPVVYSLEDREIFVAPKPHPLRLALRPLEDRRPVKEREWAGVHNFSKELAAVVTDRIIRQLRASGVFSQVQTVSGSADFNPDEPFRGTLAQDADMVLVGELIHFYGRNGPERRIEGHVQFGNLKLYSTHTGRLLWEGRADKKILRQEISPGPEETYAIEALRGAINQLAIQLSGLSLMRAELYSSESTGIRKWRVGVLPLEDLRPSEETDPETRKLKGNINYLLYSHDYIDESIICKWGWLCSETKRKSVPFVSAVTRQWVQKLDSAGIFGNVMMIQSTGDPLAGLHEWYQEGVDAVLIGQLTHSYASVIPPHDQEPFPIWSGGMGFGRLFKASALTQFEDVRLIETRSATVVWTGRSQFNIDRTLQSWESPMGIVRQSMDGALDRLVKQLSGISMIPEQEPTVP